MRDDDPGADHRDSVSEAEHQELIARYAALQQRAAALRARMGPERPPAHVIAARVLFMFGVPILAAVGIYVGTDAVLWSIAGLVGTLVLTVAVSLKFFAPDAGPGPGTRAWEAKMTANLLRDVISDREWELAGSTGETREHLTNEIAHLRRQLRDAESIAASGDTSPGTGTIGFEPYSP